MTLNNVCLVLLILAFTSVMPSSAALASACVPNPCKNGGTCTTTSTTGYTCLCPKGTYGPTCTLCSRPCPKGQYESVACSATRDRVCANCTVCSASQYIVSDCTPTTNRVCRDCTLNPYTQLCNGYGYCYFHGDSHYVTFDTTAPYTFDYQGLCKYLVSKPKVFSNLLPYFEVYARGEFRWGWPSKAFARYVEIVYGGDIIRLSRSATPSIGVIDVSVNGPTVSPPYNSLLGYNVALFGSFMRLTTWFGLIVEYDGVSEVRVYVPPTYFNNQLTGICGNFDGIVTNDPTECNGYSYAGPWNSFGDVCVVPDSDPDGCPCSYPNCRSTSSVDPPALSSCIENPPPDYVNRCKQLINTSGPFALCIRKLQTLSATTTQQLYDGCIMDACASNGEELCDSMRFLVKMCADLGIQIDYVALLRATKCSVKL